MGIQARITKKPDCKSGGESLRGFKSFPMHINSPRSTGIGGVNILDASSEEWSWQGIILAIPAIVDTNSKTTTIMNIFTSHIEDRGKPGFGLDGNLYLYFGVKLKWHKLPTFNRKIAGSNPVTPTN